MKKRSLNWGLLSTARINQALIPPLKNSRRNSLLGVASRDGERSSDFARQWNIPRAYSSYEAILADPEIDVIYNPLPNSLHAEWTIRAAEAGKHVLCEKPLAITLDEVDAIREASQKNHVVIAEAFMYRHHPATVELQRLVQDGIVGDVQVVRGTFTFVLNRPGDVRWKPEMGGGSLWDIGCYPVSYTRALLGQEPQQVFGWQVNSSSGVDLSFVGEMLFPGNILAHFDCSFNSPVESLMEVIGSKGRLTIHSPFHPNGKNSRVIAKIGEEVRRLKLPVFKRLYAGEVEDLARAVLDGTPTRLSLEESRANIAVLLALYQSAQQGKPVHL